jgi:antirestriction protein ArdC
MALQNVFQKITDMFIAAIEGGLSDDKWVRPWAVLNGMPTNATTGKEYQGLNALILMLFGGGEWATYIQWGTKGGQVAKGSKGVGIIRPVFGTDKTTGEQRIVAWAGHTVFPRGTIEGLPAPVVAMPDPAGILPQMQQNPAARKLVDDCHPVIVYGGDRACYIPSMDQINMPVFEQFISAEDFHATELHEMVHWTGAKNRLNRKDNTDRFRSNSYAFEELIAELGASFLCADLGITQGYRENHAKYIKGWLEIMHGDSKAILTAASQAQRAVTCIKAGGKVPGREVVEADEAEAIAA